MWKICRKKVCMRSFVQYLIIYYYLIFNLFSGMGLFKYNKKCWVIDSLLARSPFGTFIKFLQGSNNKVQFGKHFLQSRCILGYSLVLIQPLVKHTLFRQFITIQNKCRLNTAHIPWGRCVNEWTLITKLQILYYSEKKLFFILQKLQKLLIKQQLVHKVSQIVDNFVRPDCRVILVAGTEFPCFHEHTL